MKMNENRASQIESMLKNLPQAAEQGLSGLNAGSELKARIQLAAAEQKAPRTSRLSMNTVVRLATAVCCLAVLVLALSPSLLRPDEPAMPVTVQEEQQSGAIISSGTLGGDPTAVPPVIGDLGNSGVYIRSGNSNPGYRDMWSSTTADGNFPLIGVNGKFYRMLTTPRNVDKSLRGSAVGTVSEFTTSPSLSGTDTVLSNIVSFGETVYAVRGMGDTLVTANVDGQMRLFQRVSFNGNARRGRESLADTLQVSGHVVAMELSNVGTITDPALCARLLDTLFDCASFESSGSVSSRQSLIIELDNGLVVQMAVKNDSLAACGVWSCPEFFEEFEAACE